MYTIYLLKTSVFLGPVYLLRRYLKRQQHFWARSLYIMFKCDARLCQHCLVLTVTDSFLFYEQKTNLSIQRCWPSKWIRYLPYFVVYYAHLRIIHTWFLESDLVEKVLILYIIRGSFEALGFIATWMRPSALFCEKKSQTFP